MHIAKESIASNTPQSRSKNLDGMSGHAVQILDQV